MDSHNLFLTPATYRVLRLEFAAGLATAVVLTARHLGDIRWGVFVGLFVLIDLVGYLPGAIAFRRSPTGRIGRHWYVAYNVAHSPLTAGAATLLWCWAFGPEWALLALPVHLCGDRAVFGNFTKPFGLSFEPSTHPAYQELVHRYDPVADRHPTTPLRPVPDPAPVGR